jgi:hypothetical protein
LVSNLHNNRIILERRENMALYNVRRRLAGKLPMATLLLTLVIVFSFSLAITVPAVAQDSDIKGVCVGGGEWTSLIDGTTGNTSFSLRANHSAKSSGGKTLVTYENGDYFLVAAEPESVVILDGDWYVFPSPYDPEGPTVQGYACWAIGPVVKTNVPNFENTWALLGSYDGGKSSRNKDYLIAYAGLKEGDPETPDPESARWLHAQVLIGNQHVPLVVLMTKGNTTLNVQKSKK